MKYHCAGGCERVLKVTAYKDDIRVSAESRESYCSVRLSKADVKKIVCRLIAALLLSDKEKED